MVRGCLDYRTFRRLHAWIRSDQLEKTCILSSQREKKKSTVSQLVKVNYFSRSHGDMHVHYTYRSAICLMPFCSTPALEKHPCSLHVPTSGGGHGSSVLLPLATMLPARPQYMYRPQLLITLSKSKQQIPTFLHSIHRSSPPTRSIYYSPSPAHK